MNEKFKEDLAAFVRDIREMCQHTTCSNCRLHVSGRCGGALIGSFFDADAAIGGVEAYRRRRKPCEEVIDRAVDVYTIEVEVERDRSSCANRSVDRCAEHLKQGVWQYYGCNSDVAVRVLSAKRFVLESHREETE